MPITQGTRLLSLTTPLDYDRLLVKKLRAFEAISQLFHFELEILHEETEENTPPTFEDPSALLGQPMVVRVKQNEDGTEVKRYFHGICASFVQGNRNARFTKYRAIVVPRLWILTKKSQSRIFQQKSVPDILRTVLQGFDVTWEIQGTFEPRDYCVQYRESDWNFAARLMEEEGIYFYFTHTENGHTMVVANTPGSHRGSTAKATIPFVGNRSGVSDTWQGAILTFLFDDRVSTGKHTLWDHNFELVGKKLEAQQLSRFTIGGNRELEVYDYPGGYAGRFDGITPSGGEQTSELQKIFNDNRRTVAIRQEEADVEYKNAYMTSDSCAIVPGVKFDMSVHPHSSFNGSYVPITVNTEAIQSPSYASDEEVANSYIATFAALTHGKSDSAPFRPLRRTPKPVVQGSQTAVVVGPSGEEIFTDKYGRVKVQFHWDREGRNNQTSSCWLRVAQTWAGKKWGTMFIPRIGMEVVVDFLEGDPDQPIILGSVYNAENMPPYVLPDNKTRSTIKTNSSKGGGGFNEIRFEDKKGSEQIFIHAQKNQDIRVEKDNMEWIGKDRHLIVEENQYEKVKKDKHLTVTGDQVEKVDGNIHIKVGSNKEQKIGSKFAVDAGNEIHLKAGMGIVLEATQVTLKSGGNFVNVGPAGVSIKGTMVQINSSGAAGSGGGASPGAPKDPTEADKDEAGQSTAAPSPPPPAEPPNFAQLANVVRERAVNPAAASVQAGLAAAQAAAQSAMQQGAAAANQLQQQAQAAAAAAVAAAQNQFDDLKNKADAIADKVKDKVAEAKALADDLKDQAESLADKALAAAQAAKEKAEALANEAKEKIDEAKEAVEQKVEEAKQAVEDAKQAAQEKVDEAKQAVEEAKQQVEQAAEEAKQQAEQAVAQAEEALADAKEQAAEQVEKAEQALDEAKQQAEQAAEQAQQQAEQVQQQAEQAVEQAQQQAEQVQQQAEQAAEQAQQAAEQVTEQAGQALQSAQDAIPFM